MRIYKYELQLGTNTLELPDGQAISVINQNDKFILYYQIQDDTAESETRRFEVIMTGQEFTENEGEYYNFIDTVMVDGWFVGHIFEVF